MFLRGGGQAGRSYGRADGLPPGKVNSLAVLEGKVYAGTEHGFGVFDGASWRGVPSAEKKSLRNVFLRAEPAGRGLWVGAVDLGGGLLRLEGDRWQFLGGRGVGLMNHIQAFAFEGDTAWLGSVSSGVFAKKGDELRTFRSKEGLPSETVYALEAFGGTVWAGTSKGAARYAEGRWTSYPKSPSIPLSAVFCMAAGPETLYLGGPEGLVRHSRGRFEPYPSGDPALRIGRVNALLFHEGALYVGAADGLLRVEGW
jgi:ligand-binding sensor domain-containing protein